MSTSEERVPRIFRGTRDFVGRDYNVRKWAIDIISNTFEQFGFQPLETPMIELEETLRGKYGQEGEAGWFKLSDYREAAGLRYDQTVPLARFMAMNWNEFPKPFRRYVIGPVFRKEDVQAGRYRQFTQCDFDTVGSTNPVIDAEIVAMNSMVLGRLGFTDQFEVQLNDRRLLDSMAAEMGYTDQSSTVFRAWDKLGKQSLSEVFDYFVSEIFTIESRGDRALQGDEAPFLKALKEDNQLFLRRTEQLLELRGQPFEIQMKMLLEIFRSPAVEEAMKRVEQLVGMITAMGVSDKRFAFQPLLARGLAYYTGPIFETAVQGGSVSITGGGRFDNLVESLGGPDLPASGSSFGLERVINIMEEYGIVPTMPSVPAQVFAVVFDFDNQELVKYLFDVVTGLRLTGVKVEVYTGDTRLKVGRQFDIARRKGVPVSLIIGDDEMRAGTTTFKILATGKQFTVSREVLAEQISQYF